MTSLACEVVKNWGCTQKVPQRMLVTHIGDVDPQQWIQRTSLKVMQVAAVARVKAVDQRGRLTLQGQLQSQIATYESEASGDQS